MCAEEELEWGVEYFLRGSDAGSPSLHLKLSCFLNVLLYSTQVPFICCSWPSRRHHCWCICAWERQRALVTWWEVVYVCTVPTKFNGRQPALSLLCSFWSLYCHSLRASILPTSSHSSCSSTSSHLSPFCLSLFIQVFIRALLEWERGNACIFVIVREAKL